MYSTLTAYQRTAVNRLYAPFFANVDRRDPTRTAGLRGRYSKQMDKRFRRIAQLIIETLEDNDALRLNAKAAKSFKFRNDAERVAEFMAWLRQTINDEILQIAASDDAPPVDGWQKVYVREAYGRGSEAATALMQRQGIQIPVGVGEGLDIFRLPVHQDALELLYTRQFEDLRGVTREMSTQISRVLTEGLAAGKNNRAIVKEMVDRVEKIGVTRGNTIVRTEIIRTHAEATLNRYDQLGQVRVTALVEFATAADPCPICKELNGREYTTQEARGVIPVHPNCRCTWLPVLTRG
jgi:SPP1 gp7 family putative phage head morphogenesis protein